MQIIKEYLDRQNKTINKDLVFNFFIVFSRFEYALKRAGYLKFDKNGVHPDWEKFASELKPRFKSFVTQELEPSITYLKDNPPKKQVVKNKSLDWNVAHDNQKQPIINLLIIYIRRIRNNLFHGGKFPMRPIEEPARNEKLLNNSLVILNRFLELNIKVKHYFLDSDY